jgi:hypothetical protein
MPFTGVTNLLGGGHIRPLLADIEQIAFLPCLGSARPARLPAENKGDILKGTTRRLAPKLPLGGIWGLFCPHWEGVWKAAALARKLAMDGVEESSSL